MLVNLNQSFTFFCKYLKTADLNSATVSYTIPLVHINLDWLFTCDKIHQMSRINYSYTVQTYCRYWNIKCPYSYTYSSSSSPRQEERFPLDQDQSEARNNPPPAPVTQRIPVRTDAAGVEATGALISVELGTSKTRDGEKLVRFASVGILRPWGTMILLSLSAGGRTWKASVYPFGYFLFFFFYIFSRPLTVAISLSRFDKDDKNSIVIYLTFFFGWPI